MKCAVAAASPFALLPQAGSATSAIRSADGFALAVDAALAVPGERVSPAGVLAPVEIAAPAVQGTAAIPAESIVPGEIAVPPALAGFAVPPLRAGVDRRDIVAPPAEPIATIEPRAGRAVPAAETPVARPRAAPARAPTCGAVPAAPGVGPDDAPDVRRVSREASAPIAPGLPTAALGRLVETGEPAFAHADPVSASAGRAALPGMLAVQRVAPRTSRSSEPAGASEAERLLPTASDASALPIETGCPADPPAMPPAGFRQGGGKRLESGRRPATSAVAAAGAAHAPATAATAATAATITPAPPPSADDAGRATTVAVARDERIASPAPRRATPALPAQPDATDAARAIVPAALATTNAAAMAALPPERVLAAPPVDAPRSDPAPPGRIVAAKRPLGAAQRATGTIDSATPASTPAVARGARPATARGADPADPAAASPDARTPKAPPVEGTAPDISPAAPTAIAPLLAPDAADRAASAPAAGPLPKPAASAIPDPVVVARAGQIGHDVGVEIARRVSAGGEELVVRLVPAELGRIEVRMSFDERGGLRAVIAADSPVALDMLRRDSADLSRSLSDAGVRSDAQSLRFQTDSGGGGNNSQPRSPWRDADPRTGRTAHAADDAEIAPYRPFRISGSYNLLA